MDVRQPMCLALSGNLENGRCSANLVSYYQQRLSERLSNESARPFELKIAWVRWASSLAISLPLSNTTLPDVSQIVSEREPVPDERVDCENERTVNSALSGH